MQKSMLLGLGMAAGVSLMSLVSTEAQAAAVCAANPGGSNETVSASTAGFILNTFQMKCSKNVHLAYTEDTVNIGVCSASIKGNKKFGGSTSGGAVKESGDYTPSAAVTATTAGC